MKTLPLTKGFVALVDDDCDADRWKWTAMVTGQRIKRVYAYRRTGWDQQRRRWTKIVMLHRYVMGDPPGLDVDHRDWDTLNCQRANLRLATRSKNLAHSRRAVGACGRRGVTRVNPHQNKGCAFKAQAGGKQIGVFATIDEAARAYDQVASRQFGEFAMLNFPDSVDVNCDKRRI